MTTTRKQYSPQFKARVATGGDPGREDAQPVGIAVQGASHADREMAEGGDRPTAGAVRGRPDPQGRPARRRTAMRFIRRSAG